MQRRNLYPCIVISVEVRILSTIPGYGGPMQISFTRIGPIGWSKAGKERALPACVGGQWFGSLSTTGSLVPLALWRLKGSTGLCWTSDRVRPPDRLITRSALRTESLLDGVCCGSLTCGSGCWSTPTLVFKENVRYASNIMTHTCGKLTSTRRRLNGFLGVVIQFTL
jgi:hypothetical protein